MYRSVNAALRRVPRRASPPFSSSVVSTAGRRTLMVSTSARLGRLASTPIPAGFSRHMLRPSASLLSLQQRFNSGGEEKVVKVPGMGDSITEGTIETWLVGVGDAVEEDQVVCSIETDKINHEIRAPVGGAISAILAEEGATVEVGQDLFSMVEGAEGAPKAQEQKEEKKSAPPPPKKEEKSSETDTGKAPPPPPKPQPPTHAASSSESATTHGSGGVSERRVAMTRMRKRIAERLKDSQNTAAMLTTFQECDMYNLIQMRKELKDDFMDKHGIKLGFMGAFVKASANALQNIPSVNAMIDGNDIVYRDYCDVSVAVATPKGLVTPVIRDCDQLSLAGIEQEIARMGQKARDGQISLDELAGGTFTVSNGGVFGSMLGTPIINPPQSAILGMHATVERPVVVNGEIKIRPIMYLALTYDHRLIDGREAVTFLRTVKFNIEDPRRMLLEI